MKESDIKEGTETFSFILEDFFFMENVFVNQFIFSETNIRKFEKPFPVSYFLWN